MEGGSPEDPTKCEIFFKMRETDEDAVSVENGDDLEEIEPPGMINDINIYGAASAVVNFNKIYKQEQTVYIPPNVRAQMDAELNLDAAIFQETEGFKACLKTLKTFGSVVISANPGDGKTMVATGIARHLRDVGWGTKCTPMVIKTPEEWRKYVDPTERTDQLVFIDDMFGPHNLSTDMLNQWLATLSTMEACLDKFAGHVFVIITCRKTVLAEARDAVEKFKVFNPNRIVNLSSDENLTQDDMKRLVVSHKKRARVILTEDQVNKIVVTCMRSGFPRTCRLLIRLGADPDTLIEQFQHPTDILTTELRTLFKHREKKALLYLLALCDGKLNISETIPKQTVSNLLQRILLMVGMEPSVSFGKLLESIQSVPDSYVSVEEDTSRNLIFSHPSVLCAVARLFFEENATCLLENCSMRLLSDLIRLEKDGKQDTSTTIFIKEVDIPTLIDRFINELLKGNCFQVCSHDALDSYRFVDQFLTVIKNRGLLRQLLRERSHQCVLYWSVWNKRDVLCQAILQMIKDSKIKLKFQESDRLYAVIGAIICGNTHALRVLLDTFTNRALKRSFDRLFSDQKQKHRAEGGCKTLLEMACRSKKTDVVDLILNHQKDELDLKEFLRVLRILSSIHFCDMYLHLIRSVPINILRSSSIVITLPSIFKGHIARIMCHICQQGAQTCLTFSKNDEYIIIVKEWKPCARYAEINSVELNEEFTVNITPRLTLYARKKEGYSPEVEFRNIIVAGCLEAVELMLLLDTEVNVDEPCDQEGKTPLHVAIELGDVGMVELLVKYANINIVSGRFGVPPLLLALEGGNEEIFTILLKNKADVNMKRESNGDTSLSVMCSALNADMVKRLVDAGADVNLESGHMERVTPLLKTCGIWKSNEIGKILVDGGADVNMASRHGKRLPLQVAYDNDNREVVKFMLEHGAILPKGDDGTETLLSKACRNKDIEMAKIFIKHGADVNAKSGPQGETPLLIACTTGSPAMIGLLIAEGADVNLPSGYHGISPLHMAVSSVSRNIVATLLRNGANVNTQRDMDGLTLLYVACLRKVELLDLLLDYGADVNIPNGKDNDTVLCLATSNMNVPIIKKLIAKGADVNMKGRNKESPLYIACRNGDLKSVETLVEAGAAVNQKNGDHRESALYAACVDGELSIVKFLLENKADPNSVNGMQNESPLLYLCHCSNIDEQDTTKYVNYHHQVHNMVRLLLAHGASIDAKGGPHGYMLSPLQVAEARGDEKLSLILKTMMMKTSK